MTFAPRSLLELRSYLGARTGLSPVSLGIVGDVRHARGYHLGRDRIFGPDGLRWLDYSVAGTRDRAGLSDAASAIDIGNFRRLRSMSIDLVARARAGAPGTADIREIIYSPDGQTVLRWDRARGQSSTPRAGEADNSHLWHTHVSWYRDSEGRDKIAAFRPFFDPAPPPPRAIVPAGEFFAYIVVGDTIRGREPRRTGGFSATCTAADEKPWPAEHRDVTLVRLTSGTRRGIYISAKYAGGAS